MTSTTQFSQPPPLPDDISSSFDDGAGKLSQSYLIDMDLIHFFITRTYSTFWSRPSGQLIWRDVVFQEALRQPALLNGILAISAIHKIVTTKTTADFRILTLTKQRATLEGLLALLPSVDAESCNVVFPLSMIVSYWALASNNLPRELSILSTDAELHFAPDTDQDVVSASALDQFIELVRRIQPVNAIVQAGRHWLLHGKYAEFTWSPDLADLPELSEETADVLAHLKSEFEGEGEDLRGMIDSPSLMSLTSQFRLARSSEWFELIVGWAIQLRGSFIGHLKNRWQPALILLSYWAVCFYRPDGLWWASGWSEALVVEIDGIVKGERSRLLDWPKRYLDIKVP
ncbi:hypothetical protein TruAng_012191 [Truncatella angustata]|nr:hypothetical protein TruAng_012191 [Truncatella angustata]